MLEQQLIGAPAEGRQQLQAKIADYEARIANNPPLRLWAPPRSPGGKPDEILRELGAPPEGGVFLVTDRDLAREAVAAHAVAAVDPPGDFAIGVLVYWCLKFDPIGKRYIGPSIYFHSGDFAPPVLTPDLPAGEAFAAYLDAAPVPLDPPAAGRLAVPLYRRPPDPLQRRTLPAPRAPALLERSDLDVTREAVAQWYDNLRTEAWRRYTVHRFIADLAAGELVAFDVRGERVPATFWNSNVTFDAAASDLFAPSDTRIPLRPGLRIYPATGEHGNLQRQGVVAAFGTIERAVAAAMTEHCKVLAGRRQIEKIRLLAERLPGISQHAIEASMRRLAAE